MTDVEEVKARLDLAEVIGGYIPLKQAGRNLKASCPFHQEKSASFMVSPEKGIWHCFGCQEGGDVLSFVMKYEGLDFRSALELLARKAGVELQERGPSDAKAKRERERLAQAVAQAVRYFQASLVKNPTALEYATKTRGLTRQTIKDFQIGYSPDDWNALSHFLVKKDFTAAELKQAGLVGQRPGRSDIYDMYRGRLMFTICDGSGMPVGFTGRVLGAEAQPKYLNTPATSLYDKGRVVFGLHLAKEAIRSNDEVVLVEGNMDVVASHQAGVKQVVAVSGTALTTDQLKILGRLTKTIKVCFDADAAGLKATERAIELSQNLGLTLQMVRLPGEKDPDDLIKHDVAAWKNAIAKAEYVVDYLFTQLEQQYDLGTATGKRQYGDRLAGVLRRLGDPIEQGHYVKKLADKLDIAEEAVRAKIDQKEAKAAAAQPTTSVTKPAATLAIPVASTAKRILEQSALAVTIAYPEVRMSLDDLTPAHFSEEDHQQVFEALVAVGDAPVAQLAESLPAHANYVKILALRGEEEFGSFAPADRSFEAFMLVRRLQTATTKDTQTKISHKLRAAEAKGDAELAKRLLVQYQTLITEEE
jgi:DNA primase